MESLYDTINFELSDESGNDRFCDVQSFIEESYQAVMTESFVRCTNEILSRLDFDGEIDTSHLPFLCIDKLDRDGIGIACWVADVYNRCLASFATQNGESATFLQTIGFSDVSGDAHSVGGVSYVRAPKPYEIANIG